MTADVTGVKKVTVSFNKAVDTTKAQITLKKGASAVNVSKVSFTDAKTAVIETSANLTKGEYTVEATGVADTAMTAPVNVADDEYVKTIDITTTNAPMLATDTSTVENRTPGNKWIKVNFRLLNQYEEVVNTNPATINFTASTGVTIASTDWTYKNGFGTLYVNSSNAFIPNNDVYINAVMAAGTHVATANATVKVALPANFDKAEFLGVYNTRTKKVENIDAATLAKYPSAYKLLFTMTDQYGNGVGAKDGKTAAQADMSVVSDNPIFVGVNTTASDFCTAVEYQNKEYQAIQLTAGNYAFKGGKATISVISSKTGTTSTYTIDSTSSAILTTFTLQAPADVIVEDDIVEIPFTAADQNGNPMTSADSVNLTTVTLDAGVSGGSFAFKKQTDGSTKLYLNLPEISAVTKDNDLLAYASSVVKSNGNFSSLSYTIKNRAVPTTVVGLAKDSGIATTVTYGADEQTIKISDLNIVDQYGRTMTTKKATERLDGHKVYAAKVATEEAIYISGPALETGSSTGKVTDGAIYVEVTGSAVKIGTEAVSKNGTGAKIVFGITKTDINDEDHDNNDDDEVINAASEKEIRFTSASGSLSSYDSYEVAALPTMYVVTDGVNKASGAATSTTPDWNVYVKVYGVSADGSKILLPNSQFEVKLPGWGLGNELQSVKTGNSVWRISQNNTISGSAVNWFKVSSVDSTYKDETVDLTINIFDANGAQKATKTEKLTISNKTPNVKEGKFTSDVNSVTNTAYLTVDKAGFDNFATKYVVTTSALTALIDTTTLKDQYGVKDASFAPYAIVISDVKEASDTDIATVSGVDHRLDFAVHGNNTASACISGANAGDTFKVTFKYAGGFELSCDIVLE